MTDTLEGFVALVSVVIALGAVGLAFLVEAVRWLIERFKS